MFFLVHMTIENVALTFLWHLMAFNGPCSIPMSIANVSSWKSYWGLHFCNWSLTQIWPWLTFWFKNSTDSYKQSKYWNSTVHSVLQEWYIVALESSGSLIERSLFWHYRINNFGSSMADDDDQRAPFLPIQGRWNSEMSGGHVHPHIEIRQSSIYYAGSLGRLSHRPSVWWSKYYFDWK